jgi:DNA-binding MarR family transcriptional regulator
MVKFGHAMNQGITLDDLSRWVLSVERRVLVMRALETPGAFSAADIAMKAGRSVQNISHAIHELEEKGLIECITPEKQTWKKYLLTPKGKDVLAELKSDGLIQ